MEQLRTALTCLPLDFVVLSARPNFVHNCLLPIIALFIFGMAVTLIFVSTRPRLLLLIRDLQFCCSLVVGVGLIVAMVMSWDVSGVSTRLSWYVRKSSNYTQIYVHVMYIQYLRQGHQLL